MLQLEGASARLGPPAIRREEREGEREEEREVSGQACALEVSLAREVKGGEGR